MLLVDDLAASGTKNLRHTPRGLVTLFIIKYIIWSQWSKIYIILNAAAKLIK